MLLSHQAGGKQEAIPQDVVALLKSVLTKEEKDELARDVFQEQAATQRRETPWVAWADVLKKLSGVLQDATSRRFPLPGLMLAVGLRQAGWACRSRVRSQLDIRVPKAAWRSSMDADGNRLKPQAPSNGRLGWKKLSPMKHKQVLTEHSVETCQTVVGRGRKRKVGSDGAPVGDDDLTVKRALTDTRRQIDLQNESVCKQVSMTTWYRRTTAGHVEFSKGTRKFDVCEKRLQLDKQIVRVARESLARWCAQLE